MLKKENKQEHHFIKYSSLAFEMAAIIAIGVVGGWKLDGLLNLKFPIFTLIFTTFALVVAIYRAVKDFTK